MADNEMKAKLKDFICSTLGVEADMLEFDTELFGDSSIGLDSVDSLEIISYVDGEFGVDMTGVGKEHFLSIDTIAAYITENKE
ncbi:MAG: acyl carrier protein [Ruminiclostridium sp.]|nr:acyl carrier protein [Ruminiclostridium sp.]